MLTILYPKEDFTAADIAVRLNALVIGSTDNQEVYIVPKHFGRNPEDVLRRLRKTKSAIFIAFDKEKIDRETQSDLEEIFRLGIKTYALVPKEMKVSAKLKENLRIHEYSKTSPKSLQNASSDLLKDINTRETSVVGGLLAVAGILGLGMLFLAAMTDNGKK